MYNIRSLLFKNLSVPTFEGRNMATSGNVEVGPWGGTGGAPWRFQPNGRITAIYIASGVCIDSIRFTYVDGQGTQSSPTYGGQGGGRQTIAFDNDEEIRQISGTIGEYLGVTVVTSLTITTNKRVWPTYGADGGTSFSLPVVVGKFVGFFGNSGDFLNSIGAILQP
ncbi:hypothetical protein OSB04_001510 [Centaurea solstitialis]|uniref:Jacalin-type lectin domain-containing protein n=1 Tax=Centaurea solstitialis TaxID=347529 RepID=A0AA38TRG4_9ASTR|nr:hypothetical protein OSB04_001510 [Centaurea solstitialis]